ncbi:MAG: hypothetical protein CMH49_04475 [Myxococcales bacterium]|nr:hypothetical protein [Myxococcales bacterium]
MYESTLPQQTQFTHQPDILSLTKQRLTWLLLVRVILSVGIGFSFVFLQATRLRPLYPEESLPTIISVFVAIYIFNLIFIFALGRLEKHHEFFSYFQLLIDCLGSGALMFLTGGMESPLIFLFAIHVLMGAVSLYRQGAWFVVILAMGIFALLCAHEISSLDFQRGASLRSLRYILTNGLYQLGLLSFIAVLTAYLSEQTRVAQLRLSFANSDMKTLKLLNKHLLLSVHNGIIYLNSKGLILMINQAAEEFLGLTGQGVIKEQIQTVFPHLPTKLSHLNLQAMVDEHFILTDTGVYSWEYSVLKPPIEESASEGNILIDKNFPNGQYSLGKHKLAPSGSFDRIVLDCSLSEVSPSYEPSQRGWLMILQDVSIKRRLELKVAHRERLASLGEMAAQIAHEVRNPLAGMVSSIELLNQRRAQNEEALDPLESRLLKIIGREAQRINQLTESFLRFSRPPKPHLTNFSLKLLVHELSLIQSNRLVNLLDDQVWVFADSDQVRQILWNLFNNAWEAGSEQVEISAYLIEAQLKRFWKIQVADQGAGFPNTLEDLDLIFQPFYSNKEQGTGLGLSLCRALAVQQGGHLEVARRQGGGAVFTLELPISYEV